MTTRTLASSSPGRGPARDHRIRPEALRERALAALTAARARTVSLTDPVSEPDLTAQHSP